MAAQLSNDEWRHISSFLQSASLSHVCHHTWRLLRRQYLSWSTDLSTVSQRLQLLEDDAEIYALTLRCKAMKEEGALAARTRVLDFSTLIREVNSRAEVRDAVLTQALARLMSIPSLTALSLNVENIGVRLTGAHSLATLKEAPSLRTLTLRWAIASFLEFHLAIRTWRSRGSGSLKPPALQVYILVLFSMDQAPNIAFILGTQEHVAGQ